MQLATFFYSARQLELKAFQDSIEKRYCITRQIISLNFRKSKYLASSKDDFGRVSVLEGFELSRAEFLDDDEGLNGLCAKFFSKTFYPDMT